MMHPELDPMLFRHTVHNTREDDDAKMVWPTVKRARRWRTWREWPTTNCTTDGRRKIPRLPDKPMYNVDHGHQIYTAVETRSGQHIYIYVLRLHCSRTGNRDDVFHCWPLFDHILPPASRTPSPILNSSRSNRF